MAIAKVQHATIVSAHNDATMTSAALGSATTAGNMLEVAGWVGGSGDSTNITPANDSKGNTYATSIGLERDSSTEGIALMASFNIANVGTSHTGAFTYNAGTFGADATICFAEFSGVATASALVATNSKDNTADTTSESGAVNPAETGCLYTAAFELGAAGTLSIGGGFTQIVKQESGSDAQPGMYGYVVGSGSKEAVLTHPSDEVLGVIAAYKPAVSSAPTQPPDLSAANSARLMLPTRHYAALAPAFFFAVNLATVTPPSNWQPEYPDQARPASRHAALAPQPVLGQPPIVAAVVYTFYPSYPDQVRGRVLVPEGWTVAPPQAAVAIPSNMGWQPEYPDSARPLPSPAHAGTYTRPLGQPPEAARLDWSPEFADFAGRRVADVSLLSHFTRPLGEPPDAAREMRWSAVYPDNTRDKPEVARQGHYSPVLADFTVIARFAWEPEYPAQHFTRNPVATGTFSWNTQTPDAVVLTHGWYPSYPDSARPKHFQEGYYVQPLADYAAIARFRWSPEYPVVMREAPDGNRYVGYFVTSLADFNAITQFAWRPAYPDQHFTKIPVRTGSFSWNTETPAPVIQVYGWYPDYPDRARRAHFQEGWFAPSLIDFTAVARYGWRPSYPDSALAKPTAVQVGHYTKPLLPPVAEDPNIAIQMRWSASYPDSARRRPAPTETFYSRSTSTAVLVDPTDPAIPVGGSVGPHAIKGNSLEHNIRGSVAEPLAIKGNTIDEPHSP